MGGAGAARRRAGFTGDDIPRVMFPSCVARPKMLCIMAGLVQMDSYSGMARLVLLVTLHLPLCFLPCLQARDARHHGRYGPEGMLRFAVQKTADVRSRSSSQVVDFLLRCRGLFPWSCCSADHRVSPVAPVHVVDVPVLQVVQLPRFRSCSSSTVVDFPVVSGPHGPDSAVTRGVHTGAVLGRGCDHARCWATTRPHGTDISEIRGVPTGAILGMGC